MPPELRNLGASVRARLLNRARADKQDFQILLVRYALERLLYRLSVSTHRDQFILKGAMLFATWVDAPFRPTRDLDLLGCGVATAERLAQTFREICGTAVPDDGLAFDVGALEAAPIREEAEYGGVRVRTTARLAGAVIPIQVDIGFGDAITPAPLEIDYPVLLEGPAPHLRAYPVETVVAEKFEALVSLGMANSRLKDYYDLWLISRTFQLDPVLLSEALRRTFARRMTSLPRALPSGLSDPYVAAWAGQWSAFLGRNPVAAAPEDFAMVIADLRAFLIPLLDAQPKSDRGPGQPGSA